MSQDEAGDLNDALSALEAWRGARSWARVAVASAKEAVPVGPRQVYLSTFYEMRRIEYALQAASSRPDTEDPRPDPWAQPIEQPDEAKEHHRVSLPLSGRLHLDCGLCFASGDVECATCQGEGSIGGGKSRRRCPSCRGAGRQDCESCRGSGGVYGRPVAVSEIKRCERMQISEASDLPVDALLELLDEEREGDVVQSHESERITEVPRRRGGYRDAARDKELDAIVAKLARDPGVPEGGQIRRQRLEVRAVPAWRVTLNDEQTVFVYGTPPRVSPKRALQSPLGKLVSLFIRSD